MPTDAKAITVHLNEEQVEQIVELLNIATQAAGLNAARVAIPIMDVLMAAVRRQAETSADHP